MMTYLTLSRAPDSELGSALYGGFGCCSRGDESHSLTWPAVGRKSAVGQSRRFGSPSMTSGFPPKADIVSVVGHVRKVPTGDMGSHRQMKEATN
jgi:hypothetical protein